MTSLVRQHALRLRACFLAALVSVSALAAGFDPVGFLAGYSESAHLEPIGASDTAVSDHEIGLGGLKKVRGVWRFSESERVSGELLTRTWQVHDGYTSLEVLEAMEQELSASHGAKQLFACDGRACGSGAQWANRVFGQRLLYGREDLQRYRVYEIAIHGDGDAGAAPQIRPQLRVMLFAAARSAERQYVHAEILVPSE